MDWKSITQIDYRVAAAIAMVMLSLLIISCIFGMGLAEFVGPPIMP